MSKKTAFDMNTTVPPPRTAAKLRDSNIELYRIISMILIVAHHYVVNSGLTAEGGPIYSDITSWQSIFLLLLGAWGKTGINCFMLITGYFMCKSQITMRKYVRLLAQIYLYSIVIYCIFIFTGYEAFSARSLMECLLPFTEIRHNFTGCFLMFYLCIPFLNILVNNMNEKQHIRLLIFTGFVYIFIGTVHRVEFNYVTWFCVIYFIASYIRLYPKKIYKNVKLWLIASIVSVIISSASVIVCSIFPQKFGLNPIPFIFVTDSNTFLAVTNAVTSFMFFKNLKISYNKIINSIASATFGVLCIHANSDTMRRWLWKDMLDNVGMYGSEYMVVHALLSVFGVFMICAAIDILRIKFLEKPFMLFYDNKTTALRLEKNEVK